LTPGGRDQPPFHLGIEQLDDGTTWHLTHDPTGGFGGMTWSSGLARMSDFEAKHQWLSTSPDSGFVQVAMAERRDATGVDVVRGLVPTRIGQGARIGEPVAGRAEYFELLADVFGLRFDTSPDHGDRLWTSVLDAHRRWLDENG
jgi:N-hydroxyarylamine O-acetyltransferase